MIIKLDPAIHNPLQLDRPYLSIIENKHGIYTGVTHLSNNTLIIMMTDPYHLDISFDHYITILDNWYKGGAKEPIQITFNKLNLKYLSVPQTKTISTKLITKITGTIFHFEPKSSKSKSLKVL